MNTDKFIFIIIGIFWLIGAIMYIKFMYTEWNEKYKRKQRERHMYYDPVWKNLNKHKTKESFKN